MQELASNSVGLGIRPELFDQFERHQPALDFVEAHSENYFGDSIARTKLLELRTHYPVSLHGVGLSLGRADDLDQQHLRQLKALVSDVQPAFVSEHLAWSAYSHIHLPDLLPLPLTNAAMQVMVLHVEQMQEAVGRQILIENPSNYLLFDKLEWEETDFLNELCQRSGCGILLDVNNVYVSSVNLDRDAQAYIRDIKPGHVHQLHLAGHTQVQGQHEEVLIDTHNAPVRSEVWELLECTIDHLGVKPSLIEWDSDFPDFNVLIEETEQLRRTLDKHGSTATAVSLPKQSSPTHSKEPASPGDFNRIQQQFLKAILQVEDFAPQVASQTSKRISIYQNNVDGALVDYLEGVYPAVKGVVGDDYFKQMARFHYRAIPPQWGNIHEFGAEFCQTGEGYDVELLPYLQELAAFEWLLHATYYLPRTTALDVSAYAQHELMILSVEIVPNVCHFRTTYPVLSIYQQSLPDYQGEVGVNLNAGGQNLLVYKKQQQVLFEEVNAAVVSCLDALAELGTLGQAIERCAQTLEQQELSEAIGFILSHGLLQPQEIAQPVLQTA